MMCNRFQWIKPRMNVKCKSIVLFEILLISEVRQAGNIQWAYAHHSLCRLARTEL